MPRFRSQTGHRLKRLLGVLPRQRLKSFAFQVLPLSVFSGFMDLATVAVAGRLASLLVNNEIKDSLPGIQVFSSPLGNQAIELIILLVLLAWVASGAKLFRFIFVERLTAQVWRDISNRMIGRVIGQPYDYFLTAKRSSISSQILINMQNITYSIVKPILLIVSSSIVILSISLALGIALGLKAILLLLLLGGSFLSISSFIVPYMRHYTKQRIRLDSLTSSISNQIFSSIRDIHLTHTASYFDHRFVKVGQSAQKFQWRSRLLPDLPRLIIEPLAITFIFATALIPVIGTPDNKDIASNLVPFVATFVVAAARLTPPLQDLFRSIILVRGTLPGIDSALDYLELPDIQRGFLVPGNLSPQGIFPRREISLHKVGYKYPDSEQAALRSISLTIPIGSRIALMGPTGSGKSTLSNILLAHLDPTAGQIRLDGIPLESSDISAWQRCCSEVPQNINLLDASILENVAFGCSEDQINYDDVWEALSSAQLYDLVADMPHGLYTCVGDNGLKLSGGQRQRLALARVFYRNTKFLILDEATSSLDQKTESDVINSLEIVGRRCTTVVIAHRLNTLSKCDYIYEINDGLVAASGNYDDLCNPSHKLGMTVRA